MTSIILDRDQYLELEKIGLGAFAPLTGFMDEKEFLSVVETLRLPSGAVFSLPVILDIEEASVEAIRGTEVVDLVFNGTLVGRIRPSDFFSCDRREIARKVYGTDDPDHPGVKYFYGLKPIFLGGEVELLRRTNFDISADELTPSETKQIFRERGWKRVVGFQTRNVPHRAHEYLQRIALEHADGLFVQPLVGRKRSGDYTPEAIMRGYRALIGEFLPPHRVVLGILSTLMRYAGPREAVFHAIIRRNYGCTHFIVGRDHAGVGNWYGLYDAHELTRQFDGDLGIEIMRLKGPYYCPKCDGIVTENTCAHLGADFTQQISGTYMRNILSNGNRPDLHLMRQEIVDALKGVPTFIGE
ncbi:MAG: sulfate adenylyltransferase [Gallionella sp.]|nr:sulfate adenylyltransferase [Gallionella sp.]